MGLMREEGVYSKRRLTRSIASGGVRGLNTWEGRVKDKGEVRGMNVREGALESYIASSDGVLCLESTLIHNSNVL